MKHFLLLEDDPEDQEFFMDALHSVSETAACYAVANGEEALAVLTSRAFKPDMIFTDLNMPKMNGFDFIKNIKSHKDLKDIPVIVYSAGYSQASIEQAKQLGAVAIYSKTRPGMLPQILARYMAETPGHSPML